MQCLFLSHWNSPSPPKSSKFLTVFLSLLLFLGFDKAKLKSMETYLKAVKLFRHDQDNSGEPAYSQVCVGGGGALVARLPGSGRRSRPAALQPLCLRLLTSKIGSCSEGVKYVRLNASEWFQAPRKCSVNVTCYHLTS